MTRPLLLLMLFVAVGSAHAQALPAPAKPAAAGPAAAKPPAARPPAAAKPGANAPAGPAAPEEIFAAWDKDKNRQLSLAEFKAGVEGARMAEVMARLEQQFLKADVNGSKKLEAGEYAQLPAIKRAGVSAPPFATFDTNKDGGLGPQEFVEMVQFFMRRGSGGK